MRYRTVLQAAQGDPGLLSGIGNALKSVARVAVNVLPGPVGAVARTVIGATQSRPTAAPGGAQMPVLRSLAGSSGGRVVAGISPMGTLGVTVKRGRRINPGNAKAARRAIRRIKSVRGMLKSIERQLPKRACSCGPKRGRSR